tara:strand:+ start:90 stop:317 length:228 start_codon:yes stop_codon:yes gene_type:complete
MKKIIGILLLLTLLSCEKEKVECNCGLVLSDNVNDYSVVIRNDCSKNEKKFYLQQGDWINAQVGSNYCITNVSSW